ncbi:MAG: BON domain-containing protein [Thermomicrobiaceae bacterium]|nr:BON domain-containing protein [Thermomicrobiaceae bacterium]
MAPTRDAELAQRIATLLDEAGIPAAVDVENGVARLYGAVTSPEMREAAIDLARAVDGIRAVDDQLEYEVVSPDTPTESLEDDGAFGYADLWAQRDEISDTDPDFTGDVGADAALFQRSIEEAEPYFPPTDPVVEPDTSEEELRVVGGFQDTAMDELATDPDAQPGDTRGETDRYRSRDDDDIREDVLRELREDAMTSELDLDVTVVNGVVYLRGTVPGVDDAENAESVAWRVPGVVDVQDLTDVEGV